MLYFPQLSTGSVGQYPIEKRRSARTVVNQAADGAQYKLADANAETVEWTLSFQTLSDAERDALITLFNNVEGQLGSFTFLDPGDNLLLWSEDLTQTAWVGNALLTITSGVADPNGGTAASRVSNGGEGAIAIQQTINAPGGLRYAFSLQARTGSSGQISLAMSTASASDSQTYNIGPNWTPLLLSAALGGSDEAITFGVQIPASGSVEVFGLQVEAQAGASGYKMTTERAGVYPAARFLDDAFSITADGPSQHSCRIRIHSQA
jgi:hypothetical protein